MKSQHYLRKFISSLNKKRFTMTCKTSTHLGGLTKKESTALGRSHQQGTALRNAASAASAARGGKN